MKCPESCPLYTFIQMTERLKELVIKIQKKRDKAAEKGRDWLEPDGDLLDAIKLAVEMDLILQSGALNFEKQLEKYRKALKEYLNVYKARGQVNEESDHKEGYFYSDKRQIKRRKGYYDNLVNRRWFGGKKFITVDDFVKEFDISKQSAYRALERLVDTGVLRVERKEGRSKNKYYFMEVD